jgi:hypothetical protein
MTKERNKHIACLVLKGRTYDSVGIEYGIRRERVYQIIDVKVPGRNIKNMDYNGVFDETANRIYRTVTGRVCPESVRVM